MTESMVFICIYMLYVTCFICTVYVHVNSNEVEGWTEFKMRGGLYL